MATPDFKNMTEAEARAYAKSLAPKFKGDIDKGTLESVLRAISPGLAYGMGKAEESFKAGDKPAAVTQEEMLTDEQKEAQDILMQYGKGEMGGFGGPLGSYGMTGLETAAGGRLGDLLRGAMPAGLEAGQKELMDLLKTDKYDPYAKGGVFAGMKRNILREQQEQGDVVRRGLARGGGLYSTALPKEMGLLAERTTGQLSDLLAGLYQQYATQRIGAAGDLAKMGALQENISMGRIGAGYGYGQLSRILKDIEAKDKYKAWRSARGEKLQALQSVYTKQVPYGVKEFPVMDEGGDEWMNLMEDALEMGLSFA